MSSRCSVRARPLGLVVDPDSVRHPRHVVEVRDHLNGVADRGVVEFVRPESIDVGTVHLRRQVRQLDGEVAECPLARAQVCVPVVVLRMSRELVVCALCTEVVCVRTRSVVAALLRGGNRRE
jgi:hypothetical protein